jgi:hypothetical protein
VVVDAAARLVAQRAERVDGVLRVSLHGRSLSTTGIDK